MNSLKFKAKRKSIVLKLDKSCKLKYFSNLSTSQKNKSIKHLLIFKFGFSKLPYDLANEKIKNIDKKEIDFIKNKLKAQKVFRCKIYKVYFPLNYKEIIIKN